jgi:hypothetical protein
MPPLGVQKFDRGENPEGNLEKNQTSHLWGWITRFTKFNWEKKMMKNLRNN